MLLRNRAINIAVHGHFFLQRHTLSALGTEFQCIDGIPRTNGDRVPLLCHIDTGPHRAIQRELVDQNHTSVCMSLPDTTLPNSLNLARYFELRE